MVDSSSRVSPAPIVLLTDSEYDDHQLEQAAIDGAGGRLVVNRSVLRSEDDVLAIPQLGEASVLAIELAPITEAVLRAATKCSLVIRYGTGLDNIDLDAARALDVDVLGVPGYAADSVSDHTFALLLALVRSFHQAIPRVQTGRWRDHAALQRPRSLEGLVLGLVGAGAISLAVAKKAAGFGLRCVAYDPYADPETLRAAGIRPVSFQELLAASDIVSLHAPLTSATRHIIDADALSQMRPDTILINTARGGLIDEAALLASLDAGHLFAAGLDVTDPEPPTADSPLRRHPSVLLTPHIAFWSDSSERALRSAVASMAAEKLRSLTTTEEATYV